MLSKFIRIKRHLSIDTGSSGFVTTGVWHRWLFIVITTGHDSQVAAIDGIDEPVYVVDAS